MHTVGHICSNFKRRIRRSRRLQEELSLLAASLAGLALALCIIHFFHSRMQPILITVAQANAKNAVSRIVTDAVGNSLADEELHYQDMITLEKDAAGRITALTSNTLVMNRLRTEILRDILKQVDSLDSHVLGVPLGGLTGVDLLAGWGPDLPVRVRSVESAEAEFKNSFISEGVNQTCHRIMLEVWVELALLIPGDIVKASVVTRVCIAETILVGAVPDTYLQLSPG